MFHEMIHYWEPVGNEPGARSLCGKQVGIASRELSVRFHEHGNRDCMLCTYSLNTKDKE